jgi:hypothetical protein
VGPAGRGEGWRRGPAGWGASPCRRRACGARCARTGSRGRRAPRTRPPRMQLRAAGQEAGARRAGPCEVARNHRGKFGWASCHSSSSDRRNPRERRKSSRSQNNRGRDFFRIIKFALYGADGAYLQNSLRPIHQRSACAQCTDRHRKAEELLEHLCRN